MQNPFGGDRAVAGGSEPLVCDPLSHYSSLTVLVPPLQEAPLRGLDNSNIVCLSSGGRKSMTEVSAGLVPPEAPGENLSHIPRLAL